MTYLDNSATSYPKAPELGSVTSSSIQEPHGNPGRGINSNTTKSAKILQDLRIKVSSLLGISNPLRVALVPSSTYAINTAIYSCITNIKNIAFVISPMEHNAVTRPLWKYKETMNFPIVISGGKGMLMDPVTLRNNIQSLKNQGKNVVVIVTLSSNITGHVNNVTGISSICYETNSTLILDASQGAGSIGINVAGLKRLDYMAIPGHKGLMGPQGTGLLYVSPNSPVIPLILGGTGTGTYDKMTDVMPDILESGTLNLPGLVGLSYAIDYVASVTPQKLLTHKQNMCRIISTRLSKQPGIKAVTDPSFYNSGIYSFNIEGLDSQQVSGILDKDYGITVRGGFHCSPLGHLNLGTSNLGAVRVSPGAFTTEKEMQYACDSILHIVSIKDKY